MNRKQALKIRAERALTILKHRGDDDDWEKVVESLEEHALKLTLKERAPEPVARWRLP